MSTLLVLDVQYDIQLIKGHSAASPRPISIHPTVLNFSIPSAPSMTNIVKSAIDLIVPSTTPLTEKEWDQLDEAVRALDDSLGSAGLVKELEGVEMGDKGDKESEIGVKRKESGKIVICMSSCTISREIIRLTNGISRVAPTTFDYRF